MLQAVRWNSLFSTRSVQSSPPLPSHATLKHLYRYRASLTHHIHPSSGFYAENIATLCTLADTRQAPQVGCVANIPTARCEVVGWSGIGGGHKNAGHSFEMPWRINWRHNPMLLLLTYLRYIPPPPALHTGLLPGCTHDTTYRCACDRHITAQQSAVTATYTFHTDKNKYDANLNGLNQVH